MATSQNPTPAPLCRYCTRILPSHTGIDSAPAPLYHYCSRLLPSYADLDSAPPPYSFSGESGGSGYYNDAEIEARLISARAIAFNRGRRYEIEQAARTESTSSGPSAGAAVTLGFVVGMLWCFFLLQLGKLLDGWEEGR